MFWDLTRHRDGGAEVVAGAEPPGTPPAPRPLPARRCGAVPGLKPPRSAGPAATAAAAGTGAR